MERNRGATFMGNVVRLIPKPFTRERGISWATTTGSLDRKCEKEWIEPRRGGTTKTRRTRRKEIEPRSREEAKDPESTEGCWLLAGRRSCCYGGTPPCGRAVVVAQPSRRNGVPGL